MIVLDTHIWVWYAQGDPKLPSSYVDAIDAAVGEGLGVCSISLWEVAKNVELGRIKFSIPLSDWFRHALAFPGIDVLEMTPEIAIESTQLPGNFHKDPADQIIVATSRIYACPLVTFDSKIVEYGHVKLANL